MLFRKRIDPERRLTKKFYRETVGDGHFVCRTCGMRTKDEVEFHRELWEDKACTDLGPHNYSPARPFPISVDRSKPEDLDELPDPREPSCVEA